MVVRGSHAGYETPRSRPNPQNVRPQEGTYHINLNHGLELTQRISIQQAFKPVTSHKRSALRQEENNGDAVGGEGYRNSYSLCNFSACLKVF